MLDVLERAAVEAGRAILSVRPSCAGTTIKNDQSPVTIADHMAEAVILNALLRAFPGVPVVAEEAMAQGHIPQFDAPAFFLVDPLDGTKEYINQSADYTVNIALIENGVPVVGVVYAPARHTGYAAYKGRASKFMVAAGGDVCDRGDIRCRAKGVSLTAVASRSHSNAQTEEFLRLNSIKSCLSVGSSLKFCLLAEGGADVYPRYGRTMEWDTAAGDAVLRAAGGRTSLLDGAPLTYGKRRQASDCDFANPHFIAWGADG
ncbi:3'(2'),5'-bisphosphate nucleotidase CysQ [Rhizobium sp. Root1204]|uniref:3'(2'),5'-bisphosphate nucleotidase CysQ n=1 Tax=Rhizobium sp. Root1204 TaxID=1736428 RepID=UPI000715E522|nr:3'(2'),5'-bisphosphate nucleotidase CysQ [Rhizobium sp. Root1204]KQV38692.1 3'(2'),5'-bisphosphate nucleotidase CysQ [Rhizobium sp. Root1204]